MKQEREGEYKENGRIRERGSGEGMKGGKGEGGRERSREREKGRGEGQIEEYNGERRKEWFCSEVQSVFGSK